MSLRFQLDIVPRKRGKNTNFKVFAINVQWRFYKFLEYSRVETTESVLTGIERLSGWPKRGDNLMSLQEYVGDCEALRQVGVRKPSGEIRNQRITSENIAALKSAVTAVPETVPLRAALSSMAHDVAAFLAFLPRRVGGHNTCRQYGHVVDGRTWRDQYPKCRDCGKTIRSQEELRSAFPKAI